MRKRLNELLRAHRLAQMRVHARLTRKPAVVGKGVGAYGDDRRGRSIVAIERSNPTRGLKAHATASATNNDMATVRRGLFIELQTILFTD